MSTGNGGASSTKGKSTPSAPGFHNNVTLPLLLNVAPKIAGGIASGGKAGPSTAASGSQVTKGKNTSAPSAEIPETGEIKIKARFPLIEAINALGGPQVLLSATDLTLVTTRFPRGGNGVASGENRFVQGLQGKVSTPVKKKLDQVTVVMAVGELFRIRWDYAPSAGLHVNAEFAISNNNNSKKSIKLAFLPSGAPSVFDNVSTNRDTVKFYQIVTDQSKALEYDTRENTLQQVFTPEQRANALFTQGHNQLAKDAPAPDISDSVKQGKALAAMAIKLAQRWAAICTSGQDPELEGEQAPLKG